MARLSKWCGALTLVVASTGAACGSEVVEPERQRESRTAEPPAAEEPKEAPLPAQPALCDEQQATYEPTRPKSNILFLLDRSGSMQIKLPNAKTRWTATRDALFALIDGLPAMNTRASVMMFPQGDATVNTCCTINASNQVSCNCTSYPAPAKRCDETTYKAPMPMDLDAAAIASIKTSVTASDTSFYWGTPLAAAEAAGVRLQKTSTNDGIKSIVLLTDGAPTSCDTPEKPNANDMQLIVDAAKAGMDATGQIRTFVIGVVDGKNGNDARPDILSKVAEAGGTARSKTCATTDGCFYSVSTANLEADLNQALGRIARDATDCTFDLPPATTTSDVDKVNVTLSRAGATETIARDTTQNDGWDFVDNQSRIKLYGAACTKLQDAADAKVNVVLGCTTVTSP